MSSATAEVMSDVDDAGETLEGEISFFLTFFLKSWDLIFSYFFLKSI